MGILGELLRHHQDGSSIRSQPCFSTDKGNGGAAEPHTRKQERQASAQEARLWTAAANALGHLDTSVSADRPPSPVDRGKRSSSPGNSLRGRAQLTTDG